MGYSRTKKAAKNIFYGSISQVVTLLLNFVSRTIFIKTLGAEYLGINGLFSDVLSMLCMADLGFNTAMVYSFYKPLAENNQTMIATLITFYRKMYRIIALAITVVGVAIIPFLGYLVNLNSDIPYLRFYYIFFLLNTVMSYLFVYKTSIITADQKHYIISKYQIVINIVKIILQCILLIVTKDYFSYLVILVICTFLNNYLASKKASKMYPYIDNRNDELSQETKKEIFSNLKSVFIYKVSIVLINATDNTIISILIGTIYVGFYSNYLLVINAVTNMIKIFYNAITSSIGNVNAVEKPEQKYSIFKQLSLINMILTPTITVCVYTLMNNFINIWLGSDYILKLEVLIIIVVNFYISIVQHPVWVHREAYGLFRQTKYVMFIAAIINIILSVALGMVWGMFGIFLASAISRVGTYFIYEPIVLLKQYMNKEPYSYYVSILVNAFITTVLCMGVTFFAQGIVIDSWIKLIIKACIIFCGCLLITIVIYHKDNSMKEVRWKILNLLHVK